MSESLKLHGLSPARLLSPWGFSRQEYWSRLLWPPPGDLPDPGSSPGLLYCRQTLYRLSHQGSPSLVINNYWMQDGSNCGHSEGGMAWCLEVSNHEQLMNSSGTYGLDFKMVQHVNLFFVCSINLIGYFIVSVWLLG